MSNLKSKDNIEYLYSWYITVNVYAFYFRNQPPVKTIFFSMRLPHFFDFLASKSDKIALSYDLYYVELLDHLRKFIGFLLRDI